jgi:hypothetical protein
MISKTEQYVNYKIQIVGIWVSIENSFNFSVYLYVLEIKHWLMAGNETKGRNIGF